MIKNSMRHDHVDIPCCILHISYNLESISQLFEFAKEIKNMSKVSFSASKGKVTGKIIV